MGIQTYEPIVPMPDLHLELTYEEALVLECILWNHPVDEKSAQAVRGGILSSIAAIKQSQSARKR